MVPTAAGFTSSVARPPVALGRRHPARHLSEGHAPRRPPAPTARCSRRCRRTTPTSIRTTPCTASRRWARKGSLLTLVGTEPTVSGGNSGAPPNLGGVTINSGAAADTIDQPSDAVGLVSSGGASADRAVRGRARIPGAHQRRHRALHSGRLPTRPPPSPGFSPSRTAARRACSSTPAPTRRRRPTTRRSRTRCAAAM